MAGEWRVATIVDLADMASGKGLPKSRYSEGGQFPVMGSNGLLGWCDHPLYRHPVITVGRVGACGEVHKTNGPAWVSDNALVTTPKDGCDFRFLYYLLKSIDFSPIIGGTTQPLITQTAVKKLRVRVPDFKEQQAIACILGALDDKIDLHRRMNQTLDAMAQAIFKSWFVDFDPVRAKAADQQPPGLKTEIAALFPDAFEDSELGEIPHGWKVGVVGDLAAQAIGGQWGSDSREDGLVPAVCLRGCDMEDLRFNGYAPEAPVRFVKSNAIEKRLPTDCDVLVAASGAGPCGRPLWFAPLLRGLYEVPVIYSNFVKRFVTPSPAHAVYLDRFLINKFQDRTIHDFITGTSVPNLDASGLLAGCHIVIPPGEVLQAFFTFCSSMFAKLYARHSVLLTRTRDLLLPKLISGELRVPDAERIVGRCV